MKSNFLLRLLKCFYIQLRLHGFLSTISAGLARTFIIKNNSLSIIIICMPLKEKHTCIRLVKSQSRSTEYDFEDEKRMHYFRENIVINPERKKKHCLKFKFRKIFMAKLWINPKPNSKQKKEKMGNENKIEISNPIEFRHIVHWPVYASVRN